MKVKDELIRGIFGGIYATLSVTPEVKEILPDIKKLVADQWFRSDISGAEKQAVVIADLKELQSDSGVVARNLLSGSMSFLVSVAVTLIHAYFKTHYGALKEYLPD